MAKKDKNQNLPKEDNEFLLRAYDKLWENVIHKENRLWTFLTVYGAAVGIAIGTGVGEGLRFEAGLVILVLTYWTAEIIIDTNWWSVRNRLMVRGIERRMSETTSGVVPSFYHSARFAGESLHGTSLMIVSIIGLMIFLQSAAIFEDKWVISSRREMLSVTLLYVAAAYFLKRCLHVREKRVADFYSTFRDLNRQEAEANDGRQPLAERALKEAEDKDRRRLSARRYGIALYFLITATIAVRYHATFSPPSFWSFAVFQAVALSVLLFQWAQYRKSGANDDERVERSGFRLPGSLKKVKRFELLNLVVMLAFLASLAAPLWCSFAAPPWPEPVAAEEAQTSSASQGSQGTLTLPWAR